jgi:hypothetical protein
MLFKKDLIVKILEGKKTQTRRYDGRRKLQACRTYLENKLGATITRK